jgi:hypothetical protein
MHADLRAIAGELLVTGREHGEARRRAFRVVGNHRGYLEALDQRDHHLVVVADTAERIEVEGGHRATLIVQGGDNQGQLHAVARLNPAVEQHDCLSNFCDSGGE